MLYILGSSSGAGVALNASNPSHPPPFILQSIRIHPEREVSLIGNKLWSTRFCVFYTWSVLSERLAEIYRVRG